MNLVFALSARIDSFGRRQALALGYAGVVLVYVVTRLLLVWRFPVHVDEATFATWTLNGRTYGDTALFQALANGQQPLLEWLGVAWMHAGVEPVTALRLVSFIAGGLTLAVVAVFATRIYSAPIGLLAAALYAIMPFTLLYSVLGLYDPLATAFIAAAMLLQYELARKPRLDLALLLGFAFSGAVLTKLTAYSALYLVPVSALIFDWRRAGLPRRLAVWVGGLAAAFFMAWIASRIIQLSEFANDLSKSREVLAKNSLGTVLNDPGYWISRNWPPYRNGIHVYMTAPLVVAAAVGVALLLKHRWRVGAYLSVWIVVPLGGLVLLAQIPYSRWLVIIAPPLIIVAAGGLVETIRWIGSLARPSRGRWLVVVAAVVAVLPALVFDARLLASPTQQPLPGDDDEAYITGYPAGTPWKAVGAELRRLSVGRKLVVAAAPNCCGYLPLVIRHDPAISLLQIEATDIPGALYAIDNGTALPPRASGLSWRRSWTYTRPRHGLPVNLYQSGVVINLKFAGSPDELRAGIGGTDADYDAYLRAHPAVKAWVDSWYATNQTG